MKESLPFVTQNTKLAQALQSAGFELMDVWNVYDDDILARLKLPSAKAAHAAGLPGAISYFFRATDKLGECLDAWDSMGARIKSGDLPEIDISASDLMRVARLLLDQRNDFAGLWRASVPQYMESAGEARDNVSLRDNNGRPVEGVKTHPGFKLVSVNASEKTRGVLAL